MKATAAWMVMLVSAAAMAGCVVCSAPGGDVTERGTVLFRAEASSVVARPDDALAALEARMAAAAMAKAALLEKVLGAEVTGEVIVDGLMFEDQQASVYVEGMLPGATVACTESADGKTVTAVAELELTRRELRHLCRCGE
jgi:hypothetical protein